MLFPPYLFFSYPHLPQSAAEHQCVVYELSKNEISALCQKRCQGDTNGTVRSGKVQTGTF